MHTTLDLRSTTCTDVLLHRGHVNGEQENYLLTLYAGTTDANIQNLVKIAAPVNPATNDVAQPPLVLSRIQMIDTKS